METEMDTRYKHNMGLGDCIGCGGESEREATTDECWRARVNMLLYNPSLDHDQDESDGRTNEGYGYGKQTDGGQGHGTCVWMNGMDECVDMDGDRSGDESERATVRGTGHHR